MARYAFGATPYLLESQQPMKMKLGLPLLGLLCSVTLIGQSGPTLKLDPAPRSGFPTSDTAYTSTYRPKPVKITADMRVKDDAEARREWMKERMGGPLTADFRDAMLAEMATVQAAHPGAFGSGAAGAWTPVGPVRSNWIQNGVRLTKSDTGRMRTILVHPSNPDIVYLLTSGGGLWKTSNFLAPRPQWDAKSDSIGTAGGAVAFGANPNTLFLGMGDPFDGGVGGFVVKSTNGGDTWGSPQALGSATIVTDVKADGNTVFVGTNSGLWRSDDGGTTYVAAGPVATPFGVSARNHPSFTAWSIARTNGAWLVSYQVSGFYGAIYRSTDGANWTPIVPFTGAPTDIGRTTLAVGEAGDPVVYAFAAKIGDSAQKDLLRSADSGQSFTAVGLPDKKPVNPNDEQPDMNIMRDQAFYNQMIVVDPNDATRNTVYIGGQLSSAKTSDGGKTWRLTSNWLAQFGLPYVHADFHAAAISPWTKALFFGTDGGLFVSTDGGATFSDQKNDGIASYLVYAMATNEKNPSDVIIGLQDNGTRLRVGNSDTFNQVFGGDGFGVGWGDANTLGSIYFSFMFRTPLGTPATQQKWFVGYNGISDDEFYTKDPDTGELTWPNPKMTQFISTIYEPNPGAAANGSTFYHRTKYTLYRTTNAAGVWKPVGNFKLNPDASQGEFRGIAHPIGVGYDNEREIAVAMSGGRVMISTDGGETVKVDTLNAPRIPGFASFSTAVAWANPGELYLSTENPNPNAPHLVRSKDAGATWERLDSAATGLPRVPISRILVSTRDRNTVFVGTWIGVFVSKDAGATWAPLGSGLPMAMINDLYMPADGSFLRAASYGRGIFDYKF
jgi:photosystem II stability/assembly factor-like uncharacterized protein